MSVFRLSGPRGLPAPGRLPDDPRMPVANRRQMRFRKTLTILSLVIAALAAVATVFGILASGVLSDAGVEPLAHTSVRGETVMIWGRGVYRHMSVELAPQGIAQDVVTLSLGIPVLLAALFFARKGSLRGRLVLAGALGYFTVNYVFYLVMATFNELFLVYVVLAGCAFFGFVLSMMSLDATRVARALEQQAPRRFVGVLLIVNAIAIAVMWLGIVTPYAFTPDVPPEVEHYTTLIVQGLDLSILLPASFVSGLLLLRKQAWGYVLGAVYSMFLSLMMVALVGKIVGMSFVGAEVFPAIVIIPTICLTSIGAAVWMLRSVEQRSAAERCGAGPSQPFA